MGVTTWTKAQDAILIDGLKTDQSYRQIAEKLGLSKAMISGRIHRLRKLRPHDLPLKIAPPNILSNIQRQGGLSSDKLNQTRRPSSDKDKSQHKLNAKIKPTLMLNWKQPSIIIEKPTTPPIAFMCLERGTCLWCLEDVNQEAGASMLCCAAPVMDKSKREGDRRSSHCVYHYEMSTRQHHA